MTDCVKPLCTVFVDAFAFSSYVAIGEEPFEGSHLYKLRPGIGYSSNLHHVIFQGNSPDDIGFFTDYAFNLSSTKLSVGKIKRFLDYVDAANSLVRYVRRRLTGRNDNIPFSESGCFKQSSSYLFQDVDEVEVFGRKSRVFSSESIDHAFEDAENWIVEGCQNVTVAINELDELGHQYGSASKEYELAARHVIERCRSLFSVFKSAHPDGVCMLISDHGMADEYAAVNVIDGLYERFGLPGKDYFFFCDSVYMRVWTDNSILRERLGDFFASIDAIVRVDAGERERYGVTSRKFGDDIYRLKQGYVFKPNCFGVVLKRCSRGIHGYMEPSDDASGIVVCSNILVDGKEIGAEEVYGIVKQRTM